MQLEIVFLKTRVQEEIRLVFSHALTSFAFPKLGLGLDAPADEALRNRSKWSGKHVYTEAPRSQNKIENKGMTDLTYSPR